MYISTQTTHTSRNKGRPGCYTEIIMYEHNVTPFFAGVIPTYGILPYAMIPVYITLIFMGEDLYKPFFEHTSRKLDVNMCHMTSRCLDISRVWVNSI